MNTQVLGDVDLYGDHICLEEGVTTSYFFESSDNSKFFEIIMPVLPGCQEIQFAYNGFTGQGVTASDSDNDFYCFQTSESRTINTAYLGRFFLSFFFLFLFLQFTPFKIQNIR